MRAARQTIEKERLGMSLRGASILACGVLLAVGAAGASAEGTTPLSYTKEQADVGQAAYVKNCSMCHGAHLADGATGAPLKGPVFMGKYGGKSVAELFN